MKNKVSLLNHYWTDIYFYLHYPHKDKISHQVIRILQFVEKKENVGVNDIASYLQINHNTASEHVKRMIDKDYLIKKRNEFDERKVILCLTDIGREVLHRNSSLDEEKLNQILNEMTENEKKIVEQAFQLLSERAKQCI
ncbi:MarR family winged helix-turn-helix transcriptional regulator [Neobacillus drentensis]|uniref:MarR family winged helix-turn-helix transcriptional regulator n=1 Tax=Neobacillus drentensis TaxID=220684 RepID=UPI002FFE673F